MSLSSLRPLSTFTLAAKLPRMHSRKAIFLDRDGVVNIFPGADKFVVQWSDFKFMSGLREQLRRLREREFFIALITNQSGVGRGLMTLDALHDIHARMQSELDAEAFDAIYFCPHHPDDACLCRKPSPEMIERACREHNLDSAQSWMIGDSGRDIEMGRAAGCKTILCREHLPEPGKLKPHHRPDFMFQSLKEAVDFIFAAE